MTQVPSEPGLNISCAQLVELITDYLEGALDEDLAAEITAHLALCEGCTTYLEQMRSTIRMLGHAPAATLSPNIRDELMAAFRDFHTPSTTDRNRRRSAPDT